MNQPGKVANPALGQMNRENVCRLIVKRFDLDSFDYLAISKYKYSRSTPVAQLAPRNLLTRWDVSSIPANGIFLTKN